MQNSPTSPDRVRGLLENSPTIPERVRGLLEKCSLGISPTEALTLLRSLDSDQDVQETSNFSSNLWQLLRHCVVLPQCKQVQGYSGLLRKLAGAVAELERTGEKGHVYEKAVQWLLSLQGGPGQGVRDGSVRWRCCALLTGLLEAAALRGIELSDRLAHDTGEALRVRARDRTADVRLAAIEGLHALRLRAPGAAAVVADRASGDCYEIVRAAAVRALIITSDAMPTDVIARARLDRGVRVRRSLLEAMEARARSTTPGSAWATMWSMLLLDACGDHSDVVRSTAVQCLQAGIERGWFCQLLEDADHVERSSCRLTSALAMVLQRSVHTQNLQNLFMKPSSLQMAPGDSEGGSKPNPPATAVHAHITAGAVVNAGRWNDPSAAAERGKPGKGQTSDLIDVWELPLDGISAAPALMQALERRDALELRQLLQTALVAPLPLSAVARQSLARAVSEVLANAPVSDAVEMLLQYGALSMACLGGSAEEGQPTMFLAMALLRQIIIREQEEQEIGSKNQHVAAEAWFSRAAAAAMKGLMKALQRADQHLATLTAEFAAACEELEDAQWAVSACSARRRGGSSEHAPALQAASANEARLRSAVKAARSAREERQLRVVLAAVAWLRLSQVPLLKDAQQRALLEAVLRPAMEETGSGSSEALAIQVAGVFGLAIFASKSSAHSLSHWPFFIGLLKKQMLALNGQASAPTDGQGCARTMATEDLSAALRLAEVAVLFLCDGLLLHNKRLRQAATNDAFCNLAHALATLDARLGDKDLIPHHCAMFWHLRAVICDRICCVMVSGPMPHGCAAAHWILGCLLADVCGAGPGQPSLVAGHAVAALAGDEDHDLCDYSTMAPISSLLSAKAVSDCPSAVKECLTMGPAISRSRTLRFFSMLPVLSASHAGLLAAATEAFYGARMWMNTSPLPRGTSLRFVPVVRAACFSCGQLGARVQSRSREAMQVRIIRAVAGALVEAPQTERSLLADALAAALITVARGESVLEWVRARVACDDIDASKELSSLLRAWQPSSSAKPLQSLAKEVHAANSAAGASAPAADGDWPWVQSPQDKAADFRYKLAQIGLPACGGNRTPISVGDQASGGPRRRPRKRKRIDESLPRPDAGTSVDDIAAPSSAKSPHRRPVDAIQENPVEEAVPAPSPKSAPSAATWLIVDTSTETAHPLDQLSEVTIGRRPGCDICLQALAVSGRHCKLLHGEAGVELVDLGGTNGTYVNGERVVRCGRQFLHDGDVLVLASLLDGPRFILKTACPDAHEDGVEGRRCQEEGVEGRRGQKDNGHEASLRAASFSAPVATVAQAAMEVVAKNSGALEAEPRLLDLDLGVIHRMGHEGVITLGRRKDCKVVTTSVQVSGRHCELKVQGDQVVVRDTSSNGTYVNGVCLPKGDSQHLQHGDRLTLACLSGPAFVFVAAGQPVPNG